LDDGIAVSDFLSESTLSYIVWKQNGINGDAGGNITIGVQCDPLIRSWKRGFELDVAAGAGVVCCALAAIVAPARTNDVKHRWATG
jgi:hypothetical protein